MTWERSRCLTFPVVQNVLPCNNRQPQLQIRPFTSATYAALREREREKDALRKRRSGGGQQARDQGEQNEVIIPQGREQQGDEVINLDRDVFTPSPSRIDISTKASFVCNSPNTSRVHNRASIESHVLDRAPSPSPITSFGMSCVHLAEESPHLELPSEIFHKGEGTLEPETSTAIDEISVLRSRDSAEQVHGTTLLASQTIASSCGDLEAATGENINRRPATRRGSMSSYKTHGMESASKTRRSRWSSANDELLLHLRDVAQLEWDCVDTYFVGMASGAVKLRYKELDNAKHLCNRPDERNSSTVTLRSPSRRERAPTRERRKSASCRRKVFESRTLPNSDTLRKSVGRPRSTTAPHPVWSCAAGTSRTSRCGRPIKHPVRHRPDEGYT